MRPLLRYAVRGGAAVAAALTMAAAFAHSASDAYLTLDSRPSGPPGASGETLIRGQWDIALRDLDFVLRLDADGDGNITWGELRARQAAIADYAYAFLHASADGRACVLRPTGQKVDRHADGAYAALSFDLHCPGAASRLVLDYRLFFALDPSHRCILVFRNGSETATALLSPESAKIDLGR